MQLTKWLFDHSKDKFKFGVMLFVKLSSSWDVNYDI